jgi:hypothetical protein
MNLLLRGGCCMKSILETTTNIVSKQMVNIFVINNHRELLLHKQQTGAASTRYQWEIPSIIYNHSNNSLETTIQEYIYEAVGIKCTLYEAFISTAEQTKESHEGRIIIAIINHDSPDPKDGSGDYIWIPINRLLKDIHDNPSHYTNVVHNSVESVVLYLKDILKSESSHNRNEHSESV